MRIDGNGTELEAGRNSAASDTQIPSDHPIDRESAGIQPFPSSLGRLKTLFEKVLCLADTFSDNAHLGEQ